MDYEITIKLAVSSTDNSEQIAKRLRAALEFSTIREVVADALDLESDYHLADMAVTLANPAEAR